MEEKTHTGGLALARLWGAAPGVRRGPKPKIALETIVDAALAIARAEGLQAVSMAGVAAAVGCAKMALYRHVSDRDDLLAAMVDAALGEPPVPTGGWRERFSLLWDALLDLYARDAWLLALPAHVETLTPRNAAWIDAGLRLFEGSTMTPGERLGAVLLITENARFAARHRVTVEPVDDLDRLLARAASAGAELPGARYPQLAALAASGERAPTFALSPHQVRDMMMRAIADRFPSDAP